MAEGDVRNDEERRSLRNVENVVIVVS